MRNLSRALIAGSVAGALAVGALGGAAVARQAGPADTGAYELPAAASDVSSADTVALRADDPGRSPADRPRLRLAQRRGLAGVHGEATVRQRDGGFATYGWQRGEVTAASTGSLTVKSADGVSWTWTVTSDTRVRKNGAKSTASALAQGDTVFVLGQPGGAGRTALGVVVPKRSKE
ncbi:DUF5666 domain-containing protein [Sphaerisporangium fuscum]|uniref:DUF5666 domain-containing protein n=1 Tax=Sphaerisporangium fuscum TaxID=2835868 RepID=UPI001BDBBD3E|nr:DUF5666 domain-containing protein [Sphaerisporangium fuscum]